MKYKSIYEIGLRYRSLFGIYNATEKLPVFENVEEFKSYTFPKQIDFQKATQELYDMRSEEEKYNYGDDAVWRKCERAVKSQISADLAAKRAVMLEEAQHFDKNVVGLKEERTIGRLDETGYYFLGLFANEDVARKCVDVLVERDLSSEDKVVFLNEEGVDLHQDIEKE